MTDFKITKDNEFNRFAQTTPKSIDSKNRTVELSFVTEKDDGVMWHPEIGDYYEQLGLNDGEVDLTFLRSGNAPFLFDHNHTDQRGVIVSADVSDQKGRAVIRLSKSDKGEELLSDMSDGIRNNVSVGYRVFHYSKVGVRNDLPILRAIKWEPYEISSVAIAFDDNVGTNRSSNQNSNNNKVKVETMTKKVEDKEVETVDVAQVRKDEVNRVRSITEVGKKFNVDEKEINKAIDGDVTVDAFRAETMSNYTIPTIEVVENSNVDQVRSTPSTLGLTEKEAKSFSLMKAIRSAAMPNDANVQKEAGFELEVMDAASQLRSKMGLETQGIVIPHDVALQRAVNTTTAAGAISERLDAGRFIDILRNNMAVHGMGADVISSNGPFALPKQTGKAVAEWVAEDGEASESNLSVGNVAFNPKTITARSYITRNTLMNTTLDIQSRVERDLASVISLGLDKAALYGTGAAGQPTGLANATGVQTQAFATAGAPTFAEIVGMEGKVETANALQNVLHYLTHPTTKSGLKVEEVAANSGRFVWGSDGRMNGYNGLSSTQVTAGDVFFGDWSSLVIALFGGVDILVNPYSAGSKGGIEIGIFQSADVNFTNSNAFVIGQ